MTTRRDFLKAGTAAVATGIVFCGCGLLHSAHAQQPARQTLPVMVNGKRIKTIDVHAHCNFREAGALLGEDGIKLQLGPVRGAEETLLDVGQRLAAMDAQAVEMEILWINPVWYNRERDLAGQIVKIQNEKLADFCASRSDRFAAFASLTLQAPDLAVQELETAVKKQGLKGAAIGGSVNGVDFSDPEFHPVLGQGGGTWRAAFRPSARRARTRETAVGQWLARQHHRQSARHDHRAFASHLRGHTRSLSRPESDRRPWRRLPAILCRSLRPRLHGRSQRLQSRYQAEESPEPISQGRSISIRWCSRPRRSAIWRRKSAPARSCWAATTPFPGNSVRWTTSFLPLRSATTRRPTSSAAPRRSCWVSRREASASVGFSSRRPESGACRRLPRP